MQNFTLFTATTCGDRTNCFYPNKQEIMNRDTFTNAMQFDHVCGAFKNNYRSIGNFLESIVIPMDCDNDHTDSPKDWAYPINVARTIPDCTFYVNYHLPKINSLDRGTWRRLIVVPFNATIEGKSDIKNYADYLVENAGPAIMTWIMEGARDVIKANYHIEPPKIVKDAINCYRDSNDWLGNFFDACCILDPNVKESSSDFYDTYRAYCVKVGEDIRNSADFYNALTIAGIIKKRNSKGSFLYGVRLKSEFEE